MADPTRKSIFVSYSHKDSKKLEELKVMLKGKFQEENILIWDDTKIQPGEKWKEKIDEALSSARVVVLIVTNTFLASDFIIKEELPYVFDKENEGLLKIAWIYWDYCNYEGTELENFQALNDLTRPLSKLVKPERQAKLSEIVHNLYMMSQEQ